MKQKLNIKICQVNFVVGDLQGNSQKITDIYNDALYQNLDLLVFSELAITGYPCDDLLFKDYFIDEVEDYIAKICQITANKDTAILIGAPVYFSDRFENKNLYNCAILIENGEVIKVIQKNNLPNYGVFDEKRYFSKAHHLTDVKFRGFRLAILICADIWLQKNAFLLSDKNLDAVIAINASPFSNNKIEKRHQIAKNFIKNIKIPLIYVNQIGGQDGLVFDGSSFVLDKDGDVALQLAEFSEDDANVTLDHDGLISHLKDIDNSKIGDSKEGRIYNCCILGIRDYLAKNNFEKVVIGMSGGIDSALVACMAVDALGSKNVKLVALPSKFNSQESFDDANECSKNLGIKLESVAIENLFTQYQKSLQEQFQGIKADLTEENLQSRIRGNILMAISNKFGHLLLTTGNKSEMAVGYATIYGDMCGALNPIKDIYKSEIFSLARWRNANIPNISIYQQKSLIPNNIITKEPSAELRENQKDSDSLPSYDILDKILFNLIEEQKSLEQIIALGFDQNIVKKVAKLLYNSEYKRKQAVFGIKVSKMSFDKDRRYQITNKFCY